MEYHWHSRIGVFKIVAGPRGWGLWLDDDHFDGPFATAQQALDDLAGGHSFWPTDVDPSELGLPEEIGAWHALRRR